MLSKIAGFLVWVALSIASKFGELIAWTLGEGEASNTVTDAALLMIILGETAKEKGVVEFYRALKDEDSP